MNIYLSNTLSNTLNLEALLDENFSTKKIFPHASFRRCKNLGGELNPDLFCHDAINIVNMNAYMESVL